jgi:nucleoside-diphosphate-sugar epimerase
VRTAEAILITGASGRVGVQLTVALRRRGWRIRSFVHRRAVATADERVVGALGDVDSLRRAMDGVTAVVHLAAVTHARRAARYAEVNVVGTRNLVEAAIAEGAGRFIFVSTRAIDRRGGAYSRSKADAEDIVRSSGLTYTIVRFPELYGTGGSEGLDRIVSLARAGAKVPVVGRGEDLVCPMYIDDAIDACIGALERDVADGKTYTLAGDCISTRTFAEEAIRAFSSSSSIIGIPPAAVSAATFLARFAPLPIYPDQLARLRAPKPHPTAGAEHELRFSCRDLSQGLRALADKQVSG